jgi:branched-chain amino acid transport system ATP-binding protein
MTETLDILIIEHVSKQFYGVQALRDVSLRVGREMIFGIVGPNGAGKTTLFNIVSGAYPPTSGLVTFEGKDITQLPAAETARLGIARTFQIAHSFRNMNVLDNVIVGCGHRVYGSISRLVERYKTREIREKSMAFLDMVGLAEHADTLAGKLPIAQQRRMEVARALALDPKLLLLDEPCAGLTYGETESLMDLVHKVRDTRRRVFPDLTVEENLAIGAYSRTDRQEIERSMKEVYMLFPILDQRKRQVSKTLSGGEQQMLAIGRAFMANPRLLLVDEVSTGLMPIFVDKVFDALSELNRLGVSILLVEQNARKSLSTMSRGYVLETGRISLEGSSEELRSSPEVQRAYLGI